MLNLIKEWKEEKGELSGYVERVMNGEGGEVKEWVEFMLRRLLVIKEEKTGRIEEVYALLLEGPQSIQEMAAAIGTSDKNVSSQLSYIRKRGVAIGTNSAGKKYIESGELQAKA